MRPNVEFKRKASDTPSIAQAPINPQDVIKMPLVPTIVLLCELYRYGAGLATAVIHLLVLFWGASILLRRFAYRVLYETSPNPRPETVTVRYTV